MALTIRISQLGKWLSCPQHAIHDQVKHTEGEFEKKVAGAVGDLVHEKITGHVPSKPVRIVYDEKTRNEKEMHKQANLMAAAVDHEMRVRAWQVLEREQYYTATYRIHDQEIQVSGHVDLVVKCEKRGVGIVDIKTGVQFPSNVLTQLLAYARTYSLCTGKEVDFVGIIFVKRAKRGMPTTKSDAWSMAALQDQIDPSIEHAVSVAAGLSPAYFNPSKENCLYCDKHDCGMRITTR